MALVKQTLATAIYTAFKLMALKKKDPDAAMKDLSTRLATAIDAYLKSADVPVTVPAGIPVTTAGSAVAQTGATVSPAVGAGKIV